MSSKESLESAPGGIPFEEAEIEDDETPEYYDSEVLWASGRSYDSILDVCRALDVPEEDIRGKSREELIQICGYLNRNPKMDDESLRRDCAQFSDKPQDDPDIVKMNREELEECIVEGKAAEWLSRLNVTTIEQAKQQLSGKDIPKEMAEGTLADLVESQKGLVDYINQRNYDRDTGNFILNVTIVIKNSFGDQLNSIVSMLEDLKTNPKTAPSSAKEQKPSSWALWYEWFKSFLPTGASVSGFITYSANIIKRLWNWGVPVVQWIIGHAKTIRLCMVLAEHFRNYWCRQITIFLGRYTLRSDKSWLEGVSDFLNVASNRAKEVLWEAANYLILERFDEVWASLGPIVGYTFTLITGSMFGLAAKSLGGVVVTALGIVSGPLGVAASSLGGYATSALEAATPFINSASAFASICVDGLKVAAKEALQIWVIEEIIKDNYARMIRILDVRKCLETVDLTVTEAKNLGVKVPLVCSSHAKQDECPRDLCVWQYQGLGFLTGGQCVDRPNRPVDCWTFNKDSCAKQSEQCQWEQGLLGSRCVDRPKQAPPVLQTPQPRQTTSEAPLLQPRASGSYRFQENVAAPLYNVTPATSATPARRSSTLTSSLGYLQPPVPMINVEPTAPTRPSYRPSYRFRPPGV